MQGLFYIMPQTNPNRGQGVYNPVSGDNSRQNTSYYSNPNGFNPDHYLPSIGNDTSGDNESNFFTFLSSIWNDITGASSQQVLQSNEQEFQEYMYENYNSPEALVRQFNDAGINTNLIGSTSFGTAQGAASAPSVNPMVSPINANPSQAFKNVSDGLSGLGDIKLKASQSDYYKSLPDLNMALQQKYGAETNYTNTEWELAKATFDWNVENSEYSAKSMRQGYYNATVEYQKAWQEWENLVKEGAILDEEKEFKHWEAETKHKIYDILVEHGYLPDASYLDKIYTDYIYNHNSDGFNNFVRGYEMMWNGQNRSSARFGAFGNTLKVAGVEIPVEYLLQTGMDLAEVVKDITENGSGSTRFGRFVKAIFGNNDNDDGGSSESSPSLSDSEMTPQNAVSLMWQYEDEYVRSHPYGSLSKRDYKRYLISKGFSSEYLAKHWDEIWSIFDRYE